MRVCGAQAQRPRQAAKLPSVPALLKLTAGDTSRVIQVRADRSAAYGAIVGVLDQLASNGLVHIALISDPKPRADAPAGAKLAAPAP